MKQFTPIKVLIFSALFLVSFPFFAMENNGSKDEKQEILDKELNDFIYNDFIYNNPTGSNSDVAFVSKAMKMFAAKGSQPPKELLTKLTDRNCSFFNKKLRQLLEDGANPTGKIPTPAGYTTPLETASFLPFLLDSVKILLEYTSTDNLNSSGLQALYLFMSNMMISNDKLEIINIYKKKGFIFKKKELLHRLCSVIYCDNYSNFESIKKVVEGYGVHVDEIDLRGNTSMHILAQNGHYNISNPKELLSEIQRTRDLLLKNGASLDAKNNKNFTPYDITLNRTGKFYGKKLQKGSLILEYTKEFKAIFNPKQQ